MSAQHDKLNPDGSSQDGCLPSLLLAGIGLTLLLLGAAAAHAAPPVVPFSPYGTVKVSGADVTPGTVVSASCAGAVYRQTVTDDYEGVSWYWNLDIPGDDPETTTVTEGCAPGAIVSFAIGNLIADQTAVYTSGAGGRLDLTAARPSAVTLTTFAANRTQPLLTVCQHIRVCAGSVK